MKQTTLTFYGGVNEIGGNKILLEDGKVKVFFDFGQSFTMGKDYFTGSLMPRWICGLKDYFEFDLLPKIKGLYSKSQLEYTDLRYSEPSFDAVFLSHAHFDHVAHIVFIDEKIPVFCGSGTKLFLETMEDTASVSLGEHPYMTFRTGDTLKIDQLEIEPIHVDHSVPGAYGFIIHTSKGRIVYTGDLRAHGPKKEMTEEFVEKATESRPVALVTEGTRVVEKKTRLNYSESEVKEKGNEIVSGTNKIVFVAHHGRDMDRFRTIYEVAKQNGRKIVIFPRLAYLLTKLVEDEHLSFPNPLRDKNVLVYFKRKKSGTYCEEDYFVWERLFMNKMVTADDVHENQGDLVMDLDFYQFCELIDINPDEGSHFIHSMSEPFSEEDIEDQVMHNWLDHFKIKFHQLHASGHMHRNELIKMIEQINPKSVFPVHTENPAFFQKTEKKTVIVEKGKAYKI
ncbi:MBL fold metallo-hydrolase [Candidatus Bathyarchaeota archaeon]|nr:MBL fold metallo-hydrolase [Candidatus Bathyarchaeota archaeon]